MQRNEGRLFVGNLTQGLPSAPARDWTDDGGRNTEDPHLPEAVLSARRKQAEAAKEARRAATVADSHLDNQHYLQGAEEVGVARMLLTFKHPTLVG